VAGFTGFTRCTLHFSTFVKRFFEGAGEESAGYQTLPAHQASELMSLRFAIFLLNILKLLTLIDIVTVRHV
jgi:hypothetical protein